MFYKITTERKDALKLTADIERNKYENLTFMGIYHFRNQDKSSVFVELDSSAAKDDDNISSIEQILGDDYKGKIEPTLQRRMNKY